MIVGVVVTSFLIQQHSHDAPRSNNEESSCGVDLVNRDDNSLFNWHRDDSPVDSE